MRPTLNRIRESTTPGTPATVAEAATSLLNSRFGCCSAELTFRGHVESAAGEALVFASDVMLAAMSVNADHWHCDGTFKVVPRLFYQLLTMGFTQMEIIKKS
jgi:hypothetical protein